jgi:hypothetical protein
MGIAAYTYFQRATLKAQQQSLEYEKERDSRTRELALADASSQLALRRANLATAILTELKPILYRLKNIMGPGLTVGYHNPIPHPTIAEGMRSTRLFDPEAVQRLAAVAFRLGEVERLLESLRSMITVAREKEAIARQVEVTSRNTNEVNIARSASNQIAAELHELHAMARSHSMWAYERIILLVEALRAAGGVDPPPDIERPIALGDGGSLSAPPNPFE